MNKTAPPKKVLITGCSSGFGLAAAVQAAKAGYEVIATMRNMKKAEYLQIELDHAKTTAAIEHLDITDHNQIEDIARKYSPIDILVNNAGMSILGSFLDITESEMDTVFQTNYFGVVALTRAVVPAMITAGSGRIINIASLAGRIGHPFNAAYAATKHALVGFSRSIRVELKPFNIHVTSIEPGYHKTEILRANVNLTENFYNPDSPMLRYNRGFLRLMRDVIIPHAGDPADVVKTILHAMQTKNPRPHYLVGRDAKLAIAARWLGLIGLAEKEVLHKIATAARRETRRADAKQNKKKRPRKST